MVDICNIEKIKITEFDAIRLEKLVFNARQSKILSSWHSRLQMLLDIAEIVSSEKIDPARVTMNSKVLIKDKISKEQICASIVFPMGDIVNDGDEMNVSVLSPLGLSILGQKIGHVIEGRLKLEKMLYQPELAGNYEL